MNSNREFGSEYVEEFADGDCSFSCREQLLRILDELHAKSFWCFNIAPALEQFDKTGTTMTAMQGSKTYVLARDSVADGFRYVLQTHNNTNTQYVL
jgi:hypothetical protein